MPDTTTTQQEREAARTINELTTEEKTLAIRAFHAAHKVSPDFNFAPDRSWLEGYAHARATRPQRDEPVAEGLARERVKKMLVSYANGVLAMADGSLSQDEFQAMATKTTDALSATPPSPSLSEVQADVWVDVNVRKPEKNVEVLIAFRDTPLPCTGQYTASNHDTWGWCFPSENDPDETGPITHWRPLPLHPAELARLEGSK